MSISSMSKMLCQTWLLLNMKRRKVEESGRVVSHFTSLDSSDVDPIMAINAMHGLLLDHVRHCLPSFAASLFAQAIISEGVYESVCNKTLTDSDRGAALLLDSVKSRIEVVPSDFAKLVHILEKEPFLNPPLVNDLVKSCFDSRTLQVCDLKSHVYSKMKEGMSLTDEQRSGVLLSSQAELSELYLECTNNNNNEFTFAREDMDCCDGSSFCCSAQVQGSTYQDLVSSLPVQACALLDCQLDFDNRGVEKDLSEIAHHMLNWEDLELTPIDISDIKKSHQNSPSLQRSDALRRWKDKNRPYATYRKLLKLFVKAGHTRCAEAVFDVLRKKGGMNQTDSFFQELKCHDSIALVNNQASVNSCVINNCYDDSLEGDGDVTADLSDQPCTEATDVEWIAILSKFHDFVCKQELKGGISEGRCAISLSSEDGCTWRNTDFVKKLPILSRYKTSCPLGLDAQIGKGLLTMEKDPANLALASTLNALILGTGAMEDIVFENCLDEANQAFTEEQVKHHHVEEDCGVSAFLESTDTTSFGCEGMAARNSGGGNTLQVKISFVSALVMRSELDLEDVCFVLLSNKKNGTIEEGNVKKNCFISLAEHDKNSSKKNLESADTNLNRECVVHGSYMAASEEVIAPGKESLLLEVEASSALDFVNYKAALHKFSIIMVPRKKGNLMDVFLIASVLDKRKKKRLIEALAEKELSKHHVIDPDISELILVADDVSFSFHGFKSVVRRKEANSAFCPYPETSLKTLEKACFCGNFIMKESSEHSFIEVYESFGVPSGTTSKIAFSVLMAVTKLDKSLSSYSDVVVSIMPENVNSILNIATFIPVLRLVHKFLLSTNILLIVLMKLVADLSFLMVSAHLCNLILQAGDVELNPGPVSIPHLSNTQHEMTEWAIRIVVIGSPGSGKTTLLREKELSTSTQYSRPKMFDVLDGTHKDLQYKEHSEGDAVFFTNELYDHESVALRSLLLKLSSNLRKRKKFASEVTPVVTLGLAPMSIFTPGWVSSSQCPSLSSLQQAPTSEKVLGVGSYGMVFKAKCGQLPCAAKQLHDIMLLPVDSGNLLKKFEQECQFLSSLKHPNIVQCLASVRVFQSNMPALLMELMDESLTKFIERSPAYHTQLGICHDVARALAYSHGNAIIHRDLSSNNVLVNGAGVRAKVTDFGMSKIIDTDPQLASVSLTQSRAGTLAYMPPEALTAAPQYSYRQDLFSFGVLALQVITRKFPSPRDSHKRIEDPSFLNQQLPKVERSRHPLFPVKRYIFSSTLPKIQFACEVTPGVYLDLSLSKPGQVSSSQHPDITYHMPGYLQQDIWIFGVFILDFVTNDSYYLDKLCCSKSIHKFIAMKSMNMVTENTEKNGVQFTRLTLDCNGLAHISQPRYYIVHITSSPTSFFPTHEAQNKTEGHTFSIMIDCAEEMIFLAPLLLEERGLSFCSRMMEDQSLKWHRSPTKDFESLDENLSLAEMNCTLHLIAAVLGHVLFNSVFLSLVVSLQYIANVSRLATALCNLLLLCGDVETNPGPTNSSEKADYGELVTIPQVDAVWERLGVNMKIDHTSLAQIKAKHSNQSRCKREMFRLAVKKGVTWKDVIIGLCDVGLRSIVQNVCTMYDISLNGLSSYVLSADIVEADCVTPSTEVQSSSASMEFQTFQSIRSALDSELTLDPIVTANEVFYKGIITQENLHELRLVSSDKKKAEKLVSLIQDTLLEHPYKFKSLIEALRSLSTHEALANKISHLYQFNRVMSKMKKTGDELLDMNYLSAELNNSQLISDECRIKAAGAANFVDMCYVILVQLRTKGLEDAYLTLLDSFPNTKEVCATLRELYPKREISRSAESGDISPKIGTSSSAIESFADRETSRKASLPERKGGGVGGESMSQVFGSRTTSPPSSLPDTRRSENAPVVAKSPVSSTSQARMPSPDTESDSYLSADSTRMSAPLQREDSYSEFHSPEAIPMSSGELTVRHSTNMLGRAGVMDGVNVATTRKSGDSGFSTLRPSTHIPMVSLFGDGAMQPQSLPASMSKGIHSTSSVGQTFQRDRGKDISSTGSVGNPARSSAGQPARDTQPTSGTQSASGGGGSSVKDKKGEKAVKKDEVKKQKPKENKKFQSALKRWDVALVNTLLSKGKADVEQLFQPDQQTALMLAAIEGHKDMVRTLLQHGASVVARDQDGCTALYLAASNGNYEAVKILAQQQLADINIRNKTGEPLLMEPVRKGFSMVTELLVQYGAKVDVESTEGETALHVAVRKGNFDVVKVLLDANSEFTRQSKKTLLTPLEEALQGDDTEIVRLLMKAVARVNEKSHKLFTCKTGDQVKRLIEKGAKVDTRNSDEATPLLVHVQQNNIEIVKELIQQRANVDLQDRRGYSALIVAAKNGSLELAQLLVKYGAILDLKEKSHGYTALMFAIENGHVRIVRKLVLANANINLRNRDDKSSLDLAGEHGNPDILEILNMQPSASVGNDPFINILSGYMLEKGRAKRNVVSKSLAIGSTESLPRSRANSSLKTAYVPEEDSAHTLEVKKYQKRIADLETRIHDLTILGTMDIADESDLTYMERGRLESEFKKLKESKKKAEQYAVEAKQTAQRLSAENFKLREDLSKERHYNELTRKNMMREVELSVERKSGHAKTEGIRIEVFDEEVAKRAFLGRQSTSLYQRVPFTGAQIKDVIIKQTVHLNMYHVVVGGLPYSGKTTLVKTIFNLKPEQKPDEELDIYLHEAVIHRNKLMGDYDWFEISKFQANIHTITAALVYFFAKEHQLPLLDLKDMKQFDDPEIQGYFETTCKYLETLVQDIDNETVVEKMLTGSLSLINVFDVGVNRAVYEFMMAVRGRNKNMLLVNVIDLTQSGKGTMTEELDLSAPKYGGKYGEGQVSLYRDRSALLHFVGFSEAASHTKPDGQCSDTNTLIVGTHANEFRSKSECAEKEKELATLLKEYDHNMGHTSNVSAPEVVSVDATKKEDCKRVMDQLVKLADTNEGFSIDLPVKFIFLRYVLFSTKKIHMSRKEVIEYARKCGINDESEVDSFFEMFRNCASIISSPHRSEFLYEFVILLPISFLQGLNKLFRIQDEKTIPPELKEPVKYGILSERLLRALWQGSDEHMLTWEFYVNVLKNVLLLTELGGGKYFCPSLRLRHTIGDLRPTSLIISSKTAFTSFSGMQCAFVKYLTSKHKNIRLNEECSFYNCVGFISKSGDEEGKISIRFFHDFIEVSVHPSNISPSHADNLYSMLKTDCVAIMNEIGGLQYQFCVICPKSEFNPLNPTCSHFITFDILDTSARNLRCRSCKEEVTDVKGLHWVEAAYQGSRRAALEPGDLIDPQSIIQLCKDHFSSLTVEQIKTLSEKLSLSDRFSAMRHVPVDELLFHVIYSWHCMNPTATKKKLASLLPDELYKQAVALDPQLLERTAPAEQHSTFSPKEIIILASSWTEEPEELAEVLEVQPTTEEEQATDIDKCSSILQQWLDQNNGDKREKLVAKFEEKEYHGMAAEIEKLPN